MLDVDHLQKAHAGGIPKMVNGESQAENIERFYQPLRIKFARAEFSFIFFYDFRALSGPVGRISGHRFILFLFQWRKTPFL